MELEARCLTHIKHEERIVIIGYYDVLFRTGCNDTHGATLRSPGRSPARHNGCFPVPAPLPGAAGDAQAGLRAAPPGALGGWWG